MLRKIALILSLSLFSFAPAKAAETSGATAHDFAFEAITGGELSLSAYKGKTVLVVNTASRCNFTKQYGPLQSLYDEYKDRGLVIVGVPSNDFGSQEPLNEDEIRDFTAQSYSVDFPLTAKTKVRGQDASGFYKWAASQTGPLGKPRWNFHKYLIGPDGELVDWFSTMTEPGSNKLRRAIENALPAES